MLNMSWNILRIEKVFFHPDIKNQILYHKSTISSCYSSPLILNLSLVPCRDLIEMIDCMQHPRGCTQMSDVRYSTFSSNICAV